MQFLTLLPILKRGFKSLCPKCGKRRIYSSWNTLKVQCEDCALVIRKREDGTWFFMYMTTAAITGVFIIGMFLFTPKNMLTAKWIVTAVALFTFLATSEMRKSIAIAWDYWIDLNSEHPRFPV